MRILYMGIGDTPTSRALPQSWPDRFFEREVGRHEVLTFGYAPDLDIRIPLDADFDSVLAQLPQGWVPDVCVCTHVDHLMIPPGIENAPFPTVAITADWDFRIASARTMAEAFDVTIALGDESCRALETLGARHTFPFAYFGVPESEFEEPLADIDAERPIDVLFTGTINDHTHLDRSEWLVRLAQLSDRMRIFLGQPDASPGAYRDLLRRCKIVFTFHRRGELQMRFTDAVTQGAAVLDNGVETAQHFDAGSEFLHYDENNFEVLIEKYLADHELRRNVVEAARARTVREFGSVRRFEILFDKIEDYLAGRHLGPRPAAAFSPGERARRTAAHLYLSHFDTCMARTGDYLDAAMRQVDRYEDGPRKLNDLGITLFAMAQGDRVGGVEGPESARALATLEKLVVAYPGYVMGHLNLGWVRNGRHEIEAAEAHLRKALELLQSDAGVFDPWALQPHRHGPEFRGFWKSFNDALHSMMESGSDRAPRDVLAAECAHAIGRIRRHQGRVFDAYESMRSACDLNPTRAPCHRDAAHVAEVVGFISEAQVLYRQTAELLPFDSDWRLRTLRLLARTGFLSEVRTRLSEAINLCRADASRQDGVPERLSALIKAVSHTSAGSLLMGRMLSDQFALAAVSELCHDLDKVPDPRVEVRILDLLKLLGKDGDAEAWEAHILGQRAANPLEAVAAERSLALYEARLQSQHDQGHGAVSSVLMPAAPISRHRPESTSPAV